MKFKDLTKNDYIYICNECMLSELEKEILKEKIEGNSIVEISMFHNIGISTVNDKIRHIKEKMNKIQI